MRNLDDTDLEILRLLVADSRRPYSEIAEVVDLSPPAVSDRVARLKEQGVIRQFTVDVDRSQLQSGHSVMVDLAVTPGGVAEVKSVLCDTEGVEHVFVTASGRVVFYANAPGDDVREWLDAVVDWDLVRDYEVELVSDVEWAATAGGTEFALSCVECGNTVTREGVMRRVDGEIKQFCCSSCEERYVEQYEELRESA